MSASGAEGAWCTAGLCVRVARDSKGLHSKKPRIYGCFPVFVALKLILSKQLAEYYAICVLNRRYSSKIYSKDIDFCVTAESFPENPPDLSTETKLRRTRPMGAPSSLHVSVRGLVALLEICERRGLAPSLFPRFCQ